MKPVMITCFITIMRHDSTTSSVSQQYTLLNIIFF